jgi:hypothetical protein
MEKLASPNALAGYALVFLNLGMDAFTNAYQDTVRAAGVVAKQACVSRLAGGGAVPKDHAAAADVLHERMVHGVLRAVLFRLHECVPARNAGLRRVA